MTNNKPMSHALKLAAALEPFDKAFREVQPFGKLGLGSLAELWALAAYRLGWANLRVAHEALTAYRASEEETAPFYTPPSLWKITLK